jgi:hypothetical protein
MTMRQSNNINFSVSLNDMYEDEPTILLLLVSILFVSICLPSEPYKNSYVHGTLFSIPLIIDVASFL